jgi:hypothetical protein
VASPEMREPLPPPPPRRRVSSMGDNLLQEGDNLINLINGDSNANSSSSVQPFRWMSEETLAAVAEESLENQTAWQRWSERHQTVNALCTRYLFSLPSPLRYLRRGDNSHARPAWGLRRLDSRSADSSTSLSGSPLCS